MVIEIVTANGRSYCRGDNKSCAFRNGLIKKGTRVLRIKIYSNGPATAFYCHKCMGDIFDMAQKAMADAALGN